MSTEQSGLVSGNSQNKQGGATGRSRSKFPLSYSQFQTERFAEYFPFFVEEGVSGDRLPLHSNHEVQTYTLKSPILQSLSKKKDYFVVPMQAILPLNWEKWYTTANIGQNCPDDAGCGVVNFWGKIRSLFNNSQSYLYTQFSSSATDAVKLQRVFWFLLFFENFYSAGSLLKYLRISGSNFFRSEYTYSAGDVRAFTYDEFFDRIISVINMNFAPNTSIVFTLGGVSYSIVANPLDSPGTSTQKITLREALELMRDDLNFTITGINNYASLINAISTEWAKFSFNLPDVEADLNTSRLWAYQIVCAHFYSNDHIDFIYSADLYRQYIQQLVTKVSSGVDEQITVRGFSVNSLEYQYDALSAHYTDLVLSSFSSNGIFSSISSPVNDSGIESRAYFISLFGLKRSLRFQDYFTGSRAYPLAVGNASVAVNNNAVDILDLSKSSMMTKFLQAVNRSGRKFSNYMKELFGKTPAYDYHNPMYLAHTSDLVGAQETENTGAAQVSQQIAVTSRLKASSSRYAFEFEPDRDCIVIGISYYDLPRVYTRATDRQAFFTTRYDMFNPYLQFIGDQDISEAELGTDTPNEASPFSYTNRHMEYKQRYNVGVGGFCVPSTNLDNWIFPADTLRRKMVHHISPSFIRSFNSELDRFYQSLTGWSLGTYFHFIVRYDNRQDASRPMAYNPVINI